jgi:glycosyltransferase involved in cell wall biosynthesis
LGREPELLVYPRAVRSLIGDAEQVVLGFVPWQQTLRRPVIRYCQHWEPVWFSEGSRARRRAEKAMSLPGTTVVNSTWLENQFPAPRRPFLSKVFPGVDLGVFRPDGPTSSAALPPRAAGMLRVVSLGRADVPWKGGGELRQALAEGLPPLELCLFGTPDVAEARHPWGLERRLGQLGTADLATLLRSADLVVSPSWYESFPLPPLEAMACGAPVLTTREGTEDYAVHDVNAFVVPGRDSSALNAALRQLLDDLSLRQQLAQAGSRTAQQFSWDNGFKQFRRAMSWD